MNLPYVLQQLISLDAAFRKKVLLAFQEITDARLKASLSANASDEDVAAYLATIVFIASVWCGVVWFGTI